jgi:hypothetical protein
LDQIKGRFLNHYFLFLIHQFVISPIHKTLITDILLRSIGVTVAQMVK